MVDREKKAAGIAKADISTELCGIRLDNPVIPASGTFGYGREFNEFYDINCLGTFSKERPWSRASVTRRRGLRSARTA